ncbi:MAG: hypothetical protein U0840_10290 [Gemmataceae bacterium]
MTLLSVPARRALALLVLSSAVALVGCAGGKPTGSVSGKVSYKGAPVTSGFVNFFAPERGAASQGKITESGTYTLEGVVDAGTYKVYLQPPLPEQLPPGTKPKAKAPFSVPAKFLDGNSSPLSKEVKSGKNDINLDLTD